MHLGDLSVAVDFNKRNANGTALATVVDDGGAAVASATVVGDWKVNGSVFKSGTSGVTGTDGVAAVGSGGMRKVSSADVVEFCVTGISGTGLVYDGASNAVPACAVAEDGGDGGDPPPPAGFTVSVQVRKNAEVTLSWSGGSGPYAITRNGGPLVSDYAGTSYLDVPGAGDWTYEVCDVAGQCDTVQVTTKR